VQTYLSVFSGEQKTLLLMNESSLYAVIPPDSLSRLLDGEGACFVPSVLKHRPPPPTVRT
jgi:hypothetical protein